MTLEEDVAKLTERVEFLKREYNRMYHTENLLYNEILRLIGIMNLLNKALWEKRDYTSTTLKVLNSELSVYNRELLQHFEFHHRDKKERFNPKRKTNYKEYTNE
ncbi:hypothetical protein LCGC14_3043560 [marine sediment metagenome]|uniref:Uncharacterized protein n=1 Tax=marine sediment metagenome TaxID=412755 RepID=A0A0F8ZET2_9ZZZZ